MQRDIDQINVIPLVDVMLVLLVIVLTTATFISSGQIPVNLAKAKEVGDRKDAPIVITLTADGALFLNDRALPEGGLQGALTAESRESAVVVRADKVTLLERFVSVVDEVRGFRCRTTSLRTPEGRARPGLARLRPLARHSGSRSFSACETDPTRAARQTVQVERRHGVADTASSTNGITPEPGSGPISSVDDLGSLSPRAADCAGTDAPVAPATCATDDSLTISGSHNTTSRAN